MKTIVCICQQVSRECDCIVFGVGQNEKRVQLQPFDLITLQVTITKQTKKMCKSISKYKMQTLNNSHPQELGF